MKPYLLHLPKELYKETGIYTIYHVAYPNKFYVGSASGRGGFSDRFRKHYEDLTKNRHCNHKLQNVVNKYGIEGIVMEIIEIVEPSIILGIEQYWINSLNSYYNIVRNAHNTLGFKQHLHIVKSRSKPILQFDLNGTFLKEWWGLSEIRKTYPNQYCGIREACIGRYKTSMNCLWRYKDSYNEETIFYEDIYRRKLIVYNLEGIFIKTFNSVIEASKELHLDRRNIMRNVKDITKKCDQYIFKDYVENYDLKIKPYNQFHKFQKSIKITNVNTGVIETFKSLRAACKNGKYNRQTLQRALKSNIPLKRSNIIVEIIND